MKSQPANAPSPLIAETIASTTHGEICHSITDENDIKRDEDWEYKEAGIVIPEDCCQKSNLVSHARYELERAGYFDKDSDYGGMLGKGVLDLIKVFSAQGHSGCSASMTKELFKELSMFHPLGKFEPTIEESMNVSDYGCEPGECILQSVRKGSVFSRDGGKTWYDLDDKDWHFTNYTYTGLEKPRC